MSSVQVNPPKTPVTKGSNGMATATIPNVCKMPGPPAPFVPAPLPNIGKSALSPQGYSQDVTFEGNAVAIKGATFESIGDMASKGTGGGLISANCHGITKFVGPGSMDVKIEGKNVQLLTDPMLNNCAGGGSPPNAATLTGILQMSGLLTAVGERTCPLCGATDHEALEETPETQADAAALSGEYEPREAQEALNIQTAWDLDPRPPKKKGKRRPERRGTMLGVVYCKTDQKYADKSGATNLPLVGAGNTLGMETHNPGTHRGEIGNRIMDRLGNSTAAQAMWAQAEEYALTCDESEYMPMGYPPGSCAAQGAIVLCLDDGGLPKAMTEVWYSPPNQNRPTREPIWFFQAGPQGRTLQSRPFQPGETVPPCETCSTVLPWLLCFKKEDTCTH